MIEKISFFFTSFYLFLSFLMSLKLSSILLFLFVYYYYDSVADVDILIEFRDTFWKDQDEWIAIWINAIIELDINTKRKY